MSHPVALQPGTTLLPNAALIRLISAERDGYFGCGYAALGFSTTFPERRHYVSATDYNTPDDRKPYGDFYDH
jgi:hypothetical protein